MLDDIALNFDILGTATSFTKAEEFALLCSNIKLVNVISVLEQSGLQELELASMFENTFRVHGNVFGENVSTLKDRLDKFTKVCGFIGRLYSKVGNTSYMQTFYIFGTDVLTYSKLTDFLKEFEVGV